MVKCGIAHNWGKGGGREGEGGGKRSVTLLGGHVATFVLARAYRGQSLGYLRRKIGLLKRNIGLVNENTGLVCDQIDLVNEMWG